MLNHDMKIRLTYQNDQVKVARWGNLKYVPPKYETAPQSLIEQSKKLAVSLIEAGTAGLDDMIVFFTPEYTDENYSKIVLISKSGKAKELNANPQLRVKFTYCKGEIKVERWGYFGYAISSPDKFSKSSIARIEQHAQEKLSSGLAAINDAISFYASDYGDVEYSRVEIAQL
ncbi:hypothetical protein SHEWT2_02206 [Shewanella hafniensis]|uniref:hypothetical protein n=1 Tax=Shewanella sp. SM32 TaxID=2912796 RepID=UPI0013550EC0|nr:hypothetical protein [Shewanella sp. SM32]MCU8072352.1 hypothetical protein [Shewanella sp. SM32]CAD6364512.1 hypothetical protein SHEWT2_02206 [Shewanella hafniensis]